MAKKSNESPVTVRGLPPELVKKIDDYANEPIGPYGKPTRSEKIRHLIEEGFQSIQRGDSGSAVRRGA